MQTKISTSNSKLGSIPGVNLMPCKTCDPNAPCKKSCYAVKFLRRPNVLRAWTHNTDLLQNDRAAYFAGIRQFLAKKMPRFFRWHSSGDMTDMGYFREMVKIAREFPAVKFLAFTKRHDLLRKVRASTLPMNLTMIASQWPNWQHESGASPKGYRRAWMQDGTETRVPEKVAECPGACDSCGACWNLPKIGIDVVFHKH